MTNISIEKIVNIINESMIEFIASSDHHIDVFWASLSSEEMEVYQRESLRIGDKETSEKLLGILKERGIK